MKRAEITLAAITDSWVVGSEPPLRATRCGNGSSGSRYWSGNRTRSSRSSPLHDACGRMRQLATRDRVSVSVVRLNPETIDMALNFIDS
jgi:hypothetical protein